jgi:hypothetical protein
MLRDAAERRAQHVDLEDTKDKPELAAEWRHELASPGLELEGCQCITPVHSEATVPAVVSPLSSSTMQGQTGVAGVVDEERSERLEIR